MTSEKHQDNKTEVDHVEFLANGTQGDVVLEERLEAAFNIKVYLAMSVGVLHDLTYA